MHPRIPPLAVVVLLAFGGCLAGQGAVTDSPTDAQRSTSPATPATTATPSTTPPPTTTYEYGTQFVSVEPLDNQSAYVEWGDEAVEFESLASDRQRLFRDALDGRVTIPPGERNPFSFHNESRPKVVRYRGTWYYVRVAIV